MTDTDQFRSVYEIAGVYDQRLLPHYYDGIEDVDLVSDLLVNHFGPPNADLSVVEFGCGTGRMTERLAPYARRLVAADYSATMIDAVSTRFPDAETIRADTRDAVRTLADSVNAFDLVAAFWSLSYPLGEYFEAMTADGVQPVPDTVDARARALAFVRELIALVAPGGRFLAFFFDSETPEQQLVTRLWERLAPFPEGGRRYTLDLLLDGLRAAESAGIGTLTHRRQGGTAVAPDRDAALAWFSVVHLKSHPELVNEPDVQHEIATFVDRYELPGGGFALPTGVHLIDFAVADHPECHLPTRSA